jgi:glycosyltransferase involved in cell wall biosynthesis
VVDVSVIIPCRNAGEFALEAVETAVHQSESPREILLADDGSTDGATERVHELYPSVRILRGPFGGASNARNAALREARSAFVAFLDADDRWDPDHLARALELLIRRSDTAYLGHFDLLDERGNRAPMPGLTGLEQARTGLTLEEFLEFFWRGLPNAVGSASVVDREALLAIDGFDPMQLRANDFDFWLRLVRQSTWCYDPHPAVCYRMRSGGNLSADIASRSYFRLRALLRLKSSCTFHGFALKRLVRYWAIQAVRTAAVRGDDGDWSRAIELARGEIPQIQLVAWKSVKALRDRFGPLTSTRAAR